MLNCLLSIDHREGVHEDAENGPCEFCMGQDEDWKNMVIDDAVVFD